MASSTPTLPDNKEDQDKRYNPGEQQARETATGAHDKIEDYDRSADGLNELDKELDNVKNAEENSSPTPDTNWQSTYGGKRSQDGRALSAMNVRAILKKRGPLGLIALIGLGGGLLGASLFSPGLLLLQLKEVLMDKFNVQLTTMDARYTRIINSKIDKTTTANCRGSRVTVKCRYSTMSKAQVERFKANNIEVKGTVIGNRTSPTSFVHLRSDGVLEVPANRFSATFNSDEDFARDIRKSYDPKFGGFADRVWARFASKLGVTKAQTIKGDTDEERAKSVKDMVKKGDVSATFKTVKAGDKNPNTGETYTQAEADEINKAGAEAERIGNESRTATGAATEVIDEVAEATEKGIGSAASIVKLTGVADTACQAYGAVQTLGFAAKTIRAVQLARYAYVFLNVADRIKDGTATPGEVAYAGTVLTEVAYDAVSGARRAAAMNSFGYGFAAYGDTRRMSNYTMQFLAGGGLTGDLIAVTSTINAALGGSPRSVCGTLANPWVQAGSIVGGIALMIVPGAGQAISGVKLALQASAGVTFTIAMLVIPELLKDIVAGTVVDGIVGEDAGDAAVSGAGNFFGTLGHSGGLGAMTKADAIEYANLQKQTVARYGEAEAKDLSPLDPSSRYTFIGSMVSTLLPYVSTSDNTLGTSLGSVGSILTRSFASLVPTTQALTDEQQRQSMEMCKDQELLELKVATDPFCNVIYGIPPKYLNKDPALVQEELLSSGFIDEFGKPKGEYRDFIKKCIENSTPFSATPVTQENSSDEQCVVDDDNANFYLFYVDERVDESLNGYYQGKGGGGSKQEIAQQIVDLADAGKVTEYTRGESCQPEHNGCLGMIRKIADGTYDGNSTPCGVNINILKIILKAAQEYTIQINDINRQCAENTLYNEGSNHYVGNGSAIDFGAVNGRSSTGGTANDRLLANTLAEAGLLIPGTRFEQKQCRNGLANFIDNLPEGVTEFSQTPCSHMHIDVPATSDPDLIHGKSFNN